MADDTLRVSFQNERPIPVSELGKLLEDLASDYHRVTGSNLVLSSMVTGSTWLFLKDIISTLGSGAETVSSVLTAAENLHKYTKTVRDLFSASKTPPTAADIYQPDSPVVKTVERLSKMAIEQNTPFAFEIERHEKGETIKFSYQPSEAAEVRKNIRLKREMRKEAEALSVRRISAPAPQYKLEGPPSANAQDAKGFTVSELDCFRAISSAQILRIVDANSQGCPLVLTD